MSEEIQNIAIISETNCYRYLLGRMTEDEMSDFDDICFGNKSYIEELESIREEIIDRYLKKELNEKENQAFETYFLASPYHVEKLGFSRRLMETVTEKKSWLNILADFTFHNVTIISNFFSLNKLKPASLIIATLLISLGILGLLTFRMTNTGNQQIASQPTNQTNLPPNQNEQTNLPQENSNLKKDSTPIDNSEAPPVNNLTEKEKPSSKDNKNSSSSNKQSNSEVQKSQPKNNEPRNESQPVFGAFIPLLGGGSRTVGEKEGLLIINQKTPDLIPFQISAPSENPENYLIIIKTFENTEVWRSQPLKVKKSATKIFLSVPKNALADKSYKLEVFVVNDLINRLQGYTFQVKREP